MSKRKDDIGQLTIAQLEAIAARTEAAARTLRGALEMISSSRQPTTVVGGAELLRMPPVVSASPSPPDPQTEHLAAKKRERMEFLKQARASGERAQKLAQFGSADGEPVVSSITEAVELSGS